MIFDKDMNFIGDFEGLYKTEKSPWGQDGSDERLRDYYIESRLRLADLLDQIEGNVLEVGCGHGYVINELSEDFNKKFRGMDISETAIKKAKSLFPHLDFEVGDIITTKVTEDIVILNECLWYVMHRFGQVLSNIDSKYLIINMGFLKEQKYGKIYIDGWNGLLKTLLDYNYTILHANYDSNADPLMNGVVLCSKH